MLTVKLETDYATYTESTKLINFGGEKMKLITDNRLDRVKRRGGFLSYLMFCVKYGLRVNDAKSLKEYKKAAWRK